MKKTLLLVLGGSLLAVTVHAQVLLSGGLTYAQNFDTLSNTLPVAATTIPWSDNTTLPGWYATRGLPAPQAAWTSYRVDSGDNNSGGIHSLGSTNGGGGVNPITDRAFGSVGSGTPGTNAIGLRIQNDTADTLGNITISYTAEQWRNGGNVNVQTILAFSYGINAAFTPVSAVTNDPTYALFTALDFVSPQVGATAAALDGNAAANRTTFSNILLPGVTLNPGQEIMLRWLDVNDSGNDHGGGIDDLTVNFSIVPEPAGAVLMGLGVLGLVFWRRRK